MVSLFGTLSDAHVIAIDVNESEFTKPVRLDLERGGRFDSSLPEFLIDRLDVVDKPYQGQAVALIVQAGHKVRIFGKEQPHIVTGNAAILVPKCPFFLESKLLAVILKRLVQIAYRQVRVAADKLFLLH